MPAWQFSSLPQEFKEEYLDLKVLSGTTDIDDSAQTETTPWTILTIAAGVHDLHDVDVIIDLAKATTGFAAVESTANIQLCVARAVDGTNYRREAYVEGTLTGTAAANRCQKIPVGRIPAGQTVRIMAVMSADATADMELPYQIYYRGLSAPTITEVAA